MKDLLYVPKSQFMIFLVKDRFLLYSIGIKDGYQVSYHIVPTAVFFDLLLKCAEQYIR